MTFKDYAKGAGSLLDLFPEKTNFQNKIEKNPEKRIANAWNRVGNSFREAVSDYSKYAKK